MNSCLFSISYAGLWGQASMGLVDFIRHAGSLGYGSVMIAGKRPHFSPLDATPGAIASVREALVEVGVRCDVMAAYTNLSQPSSAGGEVPLIEFQIAYVESLARIAAELGAGIVRIFTSYEVEGQDLHLQWRRCVSAIREMSDRVAEYGVSLAIQNHHDLALHTEALLELLSDIDRPNCKLGFDAWSPALRGEALYESAKLAAPQVILTTNADYLKVPRYHYRPELVNYERQSPDWVPRFLLAPDSSTMPRFSKACATEASMASPPMKCVLRCGAGERGKISTSAREPIFSGCNRGN